MNYRKLGKTNFKVSEIGFGAWAIGGGWGEQNDNDSIEALEYALNNGVNFIDTAQGYGKGKSEKIIGDVLKKRKDKVYVASKTQPLPGPWPPSPYCKIEERYPEKYLQENIEERLQNLQTDSIDLLQLHTWTRAWNDNPTAFKVLREVQKKGKIKSIGVSTPEHDQNAVIDLMKKGWVDAVQIIYNIFEQEPAAELLKVAQEYNIGVIVRVALDEGMLTGKYKSGTNYEFDATDFRYRYFAGDRMERSIARVYKIQEEIKDSGYNMAQAALKFVLAHPAVSTVITGIRNITQAEQNIDVSDLPNMPNELVAKLHSHAWRRSDWYKGK